MMYIYLYITFADNTLTAGYLTQKAIKKDFDNIKEIKVYIYFSKGLPTLPFKLKIKRNGDKSKIYLYLAIGFIILACLLCALIIYFLSRKISENARIRQRVLIQLAMARQNGQYSGDDQASSNSAVVEEENRKKIEIMLKTSLAPKIFIKKYGEKDRGTCTICIEDFKENKSKVSITPCNHIFHYKCLSNWLIKNVINPKCPNCNYNIVQDFDDKKIEEIQTITVARRNNEEENIESNNNRENIGNINTNDNLVFTRNMSNRNRTRHSHHIANDVENNENVNPIQEVEIHNN